VADPGGLPGPHWPDILDGGLMIYCTFQTVKQLLQKSLYEILWKPRITHLLYVGFIIAKTLLLIGQGDTH
jgi:hypothetical protein